VNDRVEDTARRDGRAADGAGWFVRPEQGGEATPQIIWRMPYCGQRGRRGHNFPPWKRVCKESLSAMTSFSYFRTDSYQACQGLSPQRRVRTSGTALQAR